MIESYSTRETKKLASLVELYAELDRQSHHANNEIPLKNLSPSEFYSDYFYLNHPVVLEGLMTDWPALAKWSFPWLRANFGKYKIEVHANRSLDPKYEQHFRDNCSTIEFGNFIDLLLSSEETNDIYLVGRNLILERPEFCGLLNDIINPSGFLDPDALNHRNVKLWIGPRGTVTPLHHDRGSVLFGQVSGHKHVKLISPFHLPAMYNDPSTCYSEVALDGEIDLDRFPLMRDVVVGETLIGPGDFLLIPVAWWHWVRALDPSISLTFKNFFFRAGRIAWDYK